MSTNYGAVIKKYLHKEGVKVVAEKKDDRMVILYPVATRYLPGLNIIVDIFENGRCSVSAQLGTGDRVTEKIKLYSFLNESNNRFAFVTFSLDKDNDVMANMSFYLNEYEPGPMLRKYLSAFTSVCDDVVPDLLLKLWGRENEPILDLDEDIFGDIFDDEIIDLLDDSEVDSLSELESESDEESDAESDADSDDEVA